MATNHIPEYMAALHSQVRPALTAVLAASGICANIQSESATVAAVEKADRSPVTVADYASQAVVCRILAAWDGHMPIVAEETSADLRAQEDMLRQVTGYVSRLEPGAGPADVCDWVELGNGAPAAAFWTLDPIDGTAGFLRREQYAIALALIEEGEVRLGVLACPNLSDIGAGAANGCGVVFVAVKGGGAYQVPISGGAWTALAVDGAADGGSARLVESVESGHADHDGHGQIARWLGISRAPVRLDSQAKYGVVARGDASVYLRLPSPASPNYRERIWDHAAGALLVEEAGGRVTDAMGLPLDFGAGRRLEHNRGVIVSNGVLHESVLTAWRSVRNS